MAGKIKLCSQCGKKFRLIEMELKFYQKQGYPIPDKCPTCRQKRREDLRNPQQFFKRPCDSCSKEIVTTHDPKLGRTVYCEKCFADYYNRIDPLLRGEPKQVGSFGKDELSKRISED